MKNKIATISHLQAIPYKENGEFLVNLDEIDTNIRSEYRRTDSDLKSILVRESVLNKLQSVQTQLEHYDANMQLLVVEGYRRLIYQEKYYLKELLTQFQTNSSFDFEFLLERTHQLVALPSIAGHPTGGAIDLTIAHQGKEIDMGSKIAEFSFPELLPTYSSLVTPEQTKWRIMLHDLMVAEGFAPFYGEWWHFSYGDREWATFYDKPEAIYSPIFD